MSKNPFLNALVAAVYIVLVVLLMNSVSEFETNEFPLSLVTPILFLSVFTLSAAIMAYIFCFQPFKLYFNGKQKEAVILFLKTVAVFACIPISIFLLYFLKILS